MGLDPISSIADLANTVIGRIWPDKTEEEKAKLAQAFAVIQGQIQAQQGQLEIDKAEAQSSDPLQHWRGGLGWVCTLGFGYTYVLAPILQAVAAMAGHPLALPTLDLGQLSTLTVSMLGLGTLHVAERIKGAA